MADTPSPAGLTDEQIVNATLRGCKPGLDAHERRTKRYNEAFDIWRAKPPASDRELEPWRSRVRVPYAQGMIDTELANLCAGVPRCVVRPRRPGDERGAVALQHLMDFFTDEAHMAEQQPLTVQQALVYGTTVAKVPWCYRTGEKMMRTYQPDALTGQNVAVTQRVPTVLADHPDFVPWNVYDAWWDPNGRDVQSCGYVVLRCWATKEQLQKDAYNEERGEGLYRNLDALFATAAPGNDTTSAQDSLLGLSPAEKRRGMFEILEVWTNDSLVVIGNRQVLLRAAPNPYWHGHKPIVIAQTRPDLFELAGIPETDLVRDIQQVLWTLQNMTIDSLKLTVLRGVTYREGSVVDPNMINLRPLYKWGVSDHDDINFPVVPQLGSDVFTERERLLGDMERVTNVSAYLQGADSSTVNQTTATGVASLQSAANTVMKFKAKVVHDKIFQRTYEMWGDMIPQFLDRDVFVKITGAQVPQAQAMGVPMSDADPNGDVWIQIGPQDVVGGHYRFQLEGSEESLSQQQERNDAIGLLNALAPFVQTGRVNPDPVLRRVASAFGILDADSIIAPQQQAPPAAPTGQLPGAYQPPVLQNGQPLNTMLQNAIAAR